MHCIQCADSPVHVAFGPFGQSAEGTADEAPLQSAFRLAFESGRVAVQRPFQSFVQDYSSQYSHSVM